MELSLITDFLLSRHAKRENPEKPYSDYADILQAKPRVFGRFQEAFGPHAIDDLAEVTFRDFLSFKHNQHWTGLHRPTSHVCDDMPKLRSALKHLFNESIPVKERIDTLTQDQEISVPGIGVGILTPLLLVRFPAKYGVWNAKAESALKTLRVWPQLPRGASKGQKYEILNKLFLRLSDATNLDLWSLDALWHVINEECRIGSELDLVEESEEQRTFYEGKKNLISGFAYERDAKARIECIRHHGTQCFVCGFDFFDVYGPLGYGFIHVHHIKDIAIHGEANIDPKKDLAPVCPNCHAMLHRRARPARTIEELRDIIAERRQQRENL